MLKNAIVLDYDTARYPFDKVLAMLFKVSILNQLHLSWQNRTNKTRLLYEDNLLLRNKMQALKDDALFYVVYHRWIADVLSPHYGGHISYSAHPKMRIHLAGTDSVSNFHRDADVTGREQQINCYLPFTDVYESNSIYCESDYGLHDYQPINLKYGQAILWDGGYLSHGTKRNDTDLTRVSCDFRFQAKLPERVKPPWSEVLAGREESVTLDRSLPQGGRGYNKMT